jgi:hypothetical protein
LRVALLTKTEPETESDEGEVFSSVGMASAGAPASSAGGDT